MGVNTSPRHQEKARDRTTFAPFIVIGILALSWLVLSPGNSYVMLGALALGILPAYLAYKKGRNFGWWWLYGAALFLAALPHALLLRPDVQVLSCRMAGQGLKKCPYCAEMIKAEAKVCRFCGREQAGPPAPI